MFSKKSIGRNMSNARCYFEDKFRYITFKFTNLQLQIIDWTIHVPYVTLH